MKRKKIIFPIITAVVIAVAVIAAVCYGMNTVSYTKGAVIDGVYVNEWANFKFDITSWQPITDEEYASYGNENTEYGFMSYGTGTGQQFSVCFEDLSVQSEEYDAAGYSTELVKVLEKSFTEKNIPYSIGEFYETVVADETYCTFDTDIGNGKLFQRICVRIYKNRAITVSVSSTDNAVIDETFKSIVAVTE